MTHPNNISQLIAVTGDDSSILGKIVYFSLADVMIDREKLQEICDSMGVPYYGGMMPLPLVSVMNSPR